MTLHDTYLENDLEHLIAAKRQPSTQKTIDFALRWLRERGEPTDLLHLVTAAHSVSDLWQMRQRGEV